MCPAVRVSAAIGRCNFSKSIGVGGGGAEGEKCSWYHQNPPQIGFIFRSEPFSCHHWGGGGGAPKAPKELPKVGR